MRARTIAPAHMAQGSRVTKSVVPGMSGRVEIDLTPVACGGDHFAIPPDHRTDRHVIVFGGKSGLGKREFHVGFVRLHRSSLRNQKL